MRELSRSEFYEFLDEHRLNLRVTRLANAPYADSHRAELVSQEYKDECPWLQDSDGGARGPVTGEEQQYSEAAVLDLMEKISGRRLIIPHQDEHHMCPHDWTASIDVPNFAA